MGHVCCKHCGCTDDDPCTMEFDTREEMREFCSGLNISPVETERHIRVAFDHAPAGFSPCWWAGDVCSKCAAHLHVAIPEASAA